MSYKARQFGISSAGPLPIFTYADLKHDLLVRFFEGSIYLGYVLMGEVFGVDKCTVSEHLSSIFATGELVEVSVVREFPTVTTDGKNYQVKSYNLD